MNIGIITSPVGLIPSLKVYITNLVKNLNLIDKEMIIISYVILKCFQIGLK
jgi:hypothetical protein